MDDLILRCEISYECRLAPSFAEIDPVLVLNLPSTFQREPIEIEPKIDDARNEDSIEIRGRHLMDAPIKRDTCVIIRCFSKSNNRYGAACAIDGGVTSFNLASIQDKLSRSGGTFDERHDLVMHTASEEIKGSVRLRVGPGGLRLGKLRFEEQSSCDENIDCNTRGTAELFNEYVLCTSEIEKCLPISWQGTAGIRCPCDPGEERILGAPQVRPPAVAYVMYEIPDSDESFWVNLMHVVMSRMCVQDCQYLEFTVEQRASLLAKMVCAIPQYLDYIRDFVDRNKREFSNLYTKDLQQAVESFGDALWTLSGDCEDLACAISQMFDAFKQADCYKNPILNELLGFARKYVCFMCLDGVTASHIQNNVQRRGGACVKMGAHMNVNMIPIWYAYALIRNGLRCMLPRACCEIVRAAANRILGCEKLDGEGCSRKSTDCVFKLPVLVCEGTGMFDPLGHVDPAREARHYLMETAGCTAFKVVKKPIIHPRYDPETGAAIESPFFKTAMMGFTRHWLSKNVPVGGFWWVEMKGGKQCCSRGVSYCDLLSMPECSIALIPQPLMSADLLRALYCVVKNRIPPRVLRISNDSCLASGNCGLDKIKKAIHDLNARHLRCRRRCDANNGGGHTSMEGLTPVDIYIRPHVITQQFVQSVIRCLTQHRRVVYMKYFPETLSDKVGGYRVVFGVTHAC